MIDVAALDRLVAERCPRAATERVPLAHALRRVLREDVRAERDAPPFDRVLMDGFALRVEELGEGAREFRVDGVVAAGSTPPSLSAPRTAIEVMTGCALPDGADCVVPVEHVERDGQSIRVVGDLDGFRSGSSIARRGSDGESGRTVLRQGSRIGPAEVAVLATEGVGEILVQRTPRIALVTTGDEVVSEGPVDAFQIRGSHAPTLRALFEAWGPVHWTHRHARDEEGELRRALDESLRDCDFLLTTGGVSRGRWDLVPDVLAELGVERVVHRVQQRPGKPLWFGVRAETCVFGLPGNPISALCSARRHVLRALDLWAGARPSSPLLVGVEGDLPATNGLTRFVPVRIDAGRVVALAPKTSGSLHALAESAGFVEISDTAGGELVPYYPWTP